MDSELLKIYLRDTDFYMAGQGLIKDAPLTKRELISWFEDLT
jgi:hypothetical protein